jgi:Zn-dependent alcohol dehydrogenase
MRAVVFRGVDVFGIEQLDIPEPGVGEIRVKMVATGICHTDISAAHGHIPVKFPIVLGHEGAGVVDKVGAGVRSVARGDHVVLSILMPCGSCRQCVAERSELCVVSLRGALGGGMLDGTTRLSRSEESISSFFCQSSFAEYAIAPEIAAIGVDPTVPLDVVAMLGCGGMTGIGAVTRRARVPAGASVLIVGAGGVGLSAVMAAKAVGADTIIVADLVEEKLRLASQLGATHTVAAAGPDLVEAVQGITGWGTDFAFDAVGTSETLESAFRALHPGGEAIAIGMMKSGSTVTVDISGLIQQKRLTGTTGGSIQPGVDIPAALAMYRDGRLPLDRLVSARYSLEEFHNALQDIEAGQLIRAVLVH